MDSSGSGYVGKNLPVAGFPHLLFPVLYLLVVLLTWKPTLADFVENRNGYLWCFGHLGEPCGRNGPEGPKCGDDWTD